jgi:hypothetical protein
MWVKMTGPASGSTRLASAPSACAAPPRYRGALCAAFDPVPFAPRGRNSAVRKPRGTTMQNTKTLTAAEPNQFTGTEQWYRHELVRKCCSRTARNMLPTDSNEAAKVAVALANRHPPRTPDAQAEPPQQPSLLHRIRLWPKVSGHLAKTRRRTSRSPGLGGDPGLHNDRLGDGGWGGRRPPYASVVAPTCTKVQRN